MKRIYQVVSAAVVTLVVLAAMGYWGGKKLFVHVYAQAVNVLPYTMNYDNIVVHDGVEKIVGRTIESRRRDGAIHRASTHYQTNSTPPSEELTYRTVRRRSFLMRSTPEVRYIKAKTIWPARSTRRSLPA
jgi:hypothetical protein